MTVTATLPQPDNRNALIAHLLDDHCYNQATALSLIGARLAHTDEHDITGPACRPHIHAPR